LINIATFKIATVIGVLEKKLGKEEVVVELSEWEMHSLLKACHHWNKKLFKKLKVGLINEAIKEGYQISFMIPNIEVKCPKCKEMIKV